MRSSTGSRSCAGVFGIAVGEQLHGAFQVGKQDGHLLAFAFQRAARGEDFLREIGRGVGEWGLRGCPRRRRGGRRGSWRSRPDQDTARLIDRQALALDDSSLSASRCPASSWNCRWRVR